MAVWDQVLGELTRPHISYAVTGFALVLFGTISLFLKEKLYIGEATVATIYGLIVGPHCLNWFAPTTWGNTDYITLEISRIVLIVQIFAVAVELPKKYMLRHWWSVTMLLLPVMAFGWLIASVFIWKLVPSLRWIEALCIAGCVTATDPVLASAVVGKGKFSRRVPGHLRNLLSAESGCNDGMAFPFVIMAVYIILDEHHPSEIAKNFICIGVLYSCILGILIGAVIGYGARHLIKFAESFNLIDRESFLVYYFCVALFCAGVGTLCGVDDLLVAFSAGAAFSWDGWFAKKTDESHVSDVIDVLLNTAFFVYFGAVVPWPDFNNSEIGIKAWKLVCLAIIVLVVRRIPIMLAIKPITPDIHTWREALFCGHFGPIGVGAIFMSLLARAQFEHHNPHQAETPSNGISKDDPHYILLATIWPVTCFLVIASIIIHGSSIAVFTLGKRINNMAITLSYTTGGNDPSWMSRLPRVSTEGGNILQLKRMETEEPMAKKIRRRRPKFKRRKSKAETPAAPEPRDDSNHEYRFPPPKDNSKVNRNDNVTSNDQTDHEEGHDFVIPAINSDHESRDADGASTNHKIGSIPQHILDELKEGIHGDSDSEGEKEDAADPAKSIGLNLTIDLGEDGVYNKTENVSYKRLGGKDLADIRSYSEGRYIVIEDNDGNYIHKFDIGEAHSKMDGQPHLKIVLPEAAAAAEADNSKKPPPNDLSASSVDSQDDLKSNSWSLDNKDNGNYNEYGGTETSTSTRAPPRTSQQRPRRRSRPVRHRRLSTVGLPHSHERAFVYVMDDTVVVENADGDILRRYQYVRRGDAHDHSKMKSGQHNNWRGFFNKLPIFNLFNSTEDDNFKDVENIPEDILISANDLPLSAAASKAISVEDEEHIRRRLSQMMRAGEIMRRPSEMIDSQAGRNPLGLSNSRIATVRSQAIASDDEYTSEEEEDAEPETEIERHRRLAALGMISTEDPEDDRDEFADQRPGSTEPSGSTPAAEDEPKITFQLPKRPT